VILGRYILGRIIQGVVLTLLVLVSISLFFIFIGELDDIGRGYYNMVHIGEYIVLRIPGKVVEFMPLAVLIGTILSLGGLASNSEIIAMQASGVSVAGLLRSVILSAILLAFLTFLVADFVVPVSETSARASRTSAITNTPAIIGKKGIWIKDANQVIHINLLRPGGRAEGIEIYGLDEDGKLVQTLIAKTAILTEDQWRLETVRSLIYRQDSVQNESFDELIYRGKISNKLLDALLIEPRRMSSVDLYDYKTFLVKNNLDNSVESLTFWQKVFAPLTVIVMCLLAVPFVLGSQRQGNTGQRLIIGILLGLTYFVTSRLITQFGIQINLLPVINAIAPTVLFFILSIYLLYRKANS
jgi:lipopolysaccharide export system permease protein|tara:strand:- start:13267 stop:14334 length:1068 start_codon:yes stop_codon:yes gene_type:complete